MSGIPRFALAFTCFGSVLAWTSADDRLTEADKTQLDLVFEWKRQIGNDAWPGFGDAELPFVVYTVDDIEFLVGVTDPPEPWVVVPDDEFVGSPYFRRPADSPQAFAVRVGEGWGGRLNTLTFMNRRMREELASKMPERMVKHALRTMAFTAPQHASLLLHETFHALQATLALERFEAAQARYSVASRYPGDDAFAEAWDREGAALSQALAAQTREDAAEKTREFLRLRSGRRVEAKLPQSLIDYERDLEWLEGLAKYVETRILELAEERELDPVDVTRISLAKTRADAAFRIRRLGRLEGDTRFYLSGEAQARLLDRWAPDWKERAFESGWSLEEHLGDVFESAQSVAP